MQGEPSFGAYLDQSVKHPLVLYSCTARFTDLVVDRGKAFSELRSRIGDYLPRSMAGLPVHDLGYAWVVSGDVIVLLQRRQAGATDSFDLLIGVDSTGHFSDFDEIKKYIMRILSSKQDTALTFDPIFPRIRTLTLSEVLACGGNVLSAVAALLVIAAFVRGPQFLKSEVESLWIILHDRSLLYWLTAILRRIVHRVNQARRWLGRWFPVLFLIASTAAALLAPAAMLEGFGILSDTGEYYVGKGFRRIPAILFDDECTPCGLLRPMLFSSLAFALLVNMASCVATWGFIRRAAHSDTWSMLAKHITINFLLILIAGLFYRVLLITNSQALIGQVSIVDAIYTGLRSPFADDGAFGQVLALTLFAAIPSIIYLTLCSAVALIHIGRGYDVVEKVVFRMATASGSALRELATLLGALAFLCHLVASFISVNA